MRVKLIINGRMEVEFEGGELLYWDEKKKKEKRKGVVLRRTVCMAGVRVRRRLRFLEKRGRGAIDPTNIHIYVIERVHFHGYM